MTRKVAPGLSEVEMQSIVQRMQAAASEAKAPKTRCEGHGFSNPRQLVIACRCKDCGGDLHSEGVDAKGTSDYLVCTVCGCVYVIPAKKEIRR